MKFKILVLSLMLFYSFNVVSANEGDNDISFYAGTFDVIDKEGDDQTSLLGIEHKNPNLFRNTFLGKFSPISGGFITGNNSLYLYTGVEGQYGIGPLKILPSFTPGFYEKGSGKDVHHKDGNPRNNKKSNLKVVSRAKNRGTLRVRKK